MNIPRFTAEFALSGSGYALPYSARRDRTIEGAHSITAAMMDPQQQAYHDCVVDCRLGGGKNCASQCTPKTGPTGDNSTPLDLCQIELDTHPIGAELLDLTIQQLHNSGGVTQDQCYSIAVGIGAAMGAAIAKAPFPWSLFGVLAAADLGIVGKCLCDKYYG